MENQTDLKNQIVKRLATISESKLADVWKYIEQLENSDIKKQSVLSFAGSWNTIDNDIYNDLTENLISRRTSISTRQKND